jgi:hypothetical protein
MELPTLKTWEWHSIGDEDPMQNRFFNQRSNGYRMEAQIEMFFNRYAKLQNFQNSKMGDRYKILV